LLSSEDFQNQADFKLLSDLFSNFNLHVICYLREGLSYDLSGFAQRIHNSSEIFNLRQYVERQNVKLLTFLKDWKDLTDVASFKLYERNALKSRDIIADFLDLLGLNHLDASNAVYETNPSISGNLLSLKMLLNLIGQSDIVPYEAYGEAAILDANFRGKVYVHNETAAELRGLSNYNAVMRSLFPEMSEASFDSGARIFDLKRWDSDMDLISTVEGMGFAKTIRLGNLGAILQSNGLDFGFTNIDFPNSEMLEAIKIPENSKFQNIKKKAFHAFNERNIARKAQVKAEGISIKMRSDVLQTKEALSAMAREKTQANEKVRAITKKLQAAIIERDRARVSFDQIKKREKIKEGQVCFFRAELLRHKGQDDKARSLYLKALDAEPENKDYQNMVERRSDPKKA